MSNSLPVLLSMVFAAGCTSEIEDSNRPPSWLSPTSVVVGQGTTAEIYPVVEDADGDTTSFTVTSNSVEVPVRLEEGDEGTAIAEGDEGTAIVVAASYLANGAELTVELSDGNLSVPVAVPVETPEYGWRDAKIWTTDGPKAREHGAFLVDDESEIALLFGGSGYMPFLDPLADGWRLDLATLTWTQLTPSGDVPSGGGSRRVALVANKKKAYLFGGYGMNGAIHNELYELDYSGGELVFKTVQQDGAPTARQLHAFVYDPMTDRFFMFGGVALAPNNETWSMVLQDGVAHWTQLSPATAPSARYGFFHGFDDQDGKLWLFSGAQGTQPINPAQDTWVLDVRAEPPAWRLVSEGASNPPGRRNGCAVYEPRGRLVVFGGTPDAMTTSPGLWLFDTQAESWTELDRPDQPALRSSGFGIWDNGRQRTLLGFGNTTTAVYQDLNALGY